MILRKRLAKKTISADIINKRRTQVETVRRILGQLERTNIIALPGLHERVTSTTSAPRHFPKFPGRAIFGKILYDYHRNAKRKGLVFELDYEQVLRLTQAPCHYCGQEPMQERKAFGTKGTFIFNGIDRPDNTVGYIPGNVVPCCSRCNYFKGDLSEKTFLNTIREIYEYRFPDSSHRKGNTCLSI